MASYSFLIELKYVKDEGRADPALRAEVETKFAEAEEQLGVYLGDQRLRAVQGPKGWKAYSVVQVGTRALLYRELGTATQVLRWDRRRPARKASGAKAKGTTKKGRAQRGAGKQG